MTVSAQPPTWTLLRRGLLKRCPVCGESKLFSLWLRMVEDCPRCGLHFERIEGHWIGAIGMNTVVSFGAILLTLIIGLVATLPDLPVMPLILVNTSVAVIVPLAFHPVSRTFWTGIDIALRPLEPFEVDWTALDR